MMEIADDTSFLSPHERNLQAKESMRIYADYTNVRAGTSAQRSYLINELIPAAIAFYQSALKITRITVPLSVRDGCNDYYPGSAVRNGVNADLIILITAESSDETYLAYAVPCRLSNVDNRPAYGLINFNLKYLYTETTLEREENFLTTLHEMAHILGFSSGLYPFFIDSSTLQNKTVLFEKTLNGENIKYLDVEPLTTRLKNHFNCPTLEGGYLENEGGTGSAGSHWERKIFFNEFMTASSITDAVVSEFTLALLEGTGWYQVDYSFAEPFRWGYNRSCTFINNKCIDGSLNPIAQPEFCSRLKREGCTFTGRAVGFCGTRNTNIIFDDTPYDYWGNKSIVIDSFSNNCPYMVGFSPNGDCEGPENVEYAVLEAEVYTVGSRCLEGTLSDTASPSSYTGFCFPVQCESRGASYVLNIRLGDRNVTCTTSGLINVQGYTGQLMCPDPTDYCNRANPARCVRGCSGLGNCVNGICQCYDGWFGADCATKSAQGIFQITFMGITSLLLSAILVFF